MNYTLEGSDRNYNISFFDGFTSLVTGLSGLPYSIRHWKLSNTCEHKYSVGHKVIAALEAIPVFGGLAAGIERIVIFTNKKFFDSHHHSSEKNRRIFMTDATGRHQETLLKILGRGGSKTAFQIAKGRALLLPNVYISNVWERMVAEEVKMSQILTRLGLLSPLSEEVSIILDGVQMPAYVSETFENLGLRKGWFILDMKNSYTSTWKEGENFLFQSDTERLNEKNWGCVIDVLLTDIAKICLHHVPVGTDSLNIAIVRKNSLEICPYEIRYFGFDFSSKYHALDISKIEEQPSAQFDVERAENILNAILDYVFMWEFGEKYSYGEDKEKLQNFQKQLVQEQSQELVARMQRMSHSKIY